MTISVDDGLVGLHEPYPGMEIPTKLRCSKDGRLYVTDSIEGQLKNRKIDGVTSVFDATKYAGWITGKPQRAVIHANGVEGAGNILRVVFDAPAEWVAKNWLETLPSNMATTDVEFIEIPFGDRSEVLDFGGEVTNMFFIVIGSNSCNVFVEAW